MFVCVHTHTHIHIYIYIYIYIYNIHMYVYVCVCVCVYVHTHTSVYIHIHIYIYICILGWHYLSKATCRCLMRSRRIFFDRGSVQRWSAAQPCSAGCISTLDVTRQLCSDARAGVNVQPSDSAKGAREPLPQTSHYHFFLLEKEVGTTHLLRAPLLRPVR